MNDEYDRELFEQIWVDVLNKDRHMLKRNLQTGQYVSIGAECAWLGWKMRKIAEQSGLLEQHANAVKTDSIN